MALRILLVGSGYVAPFHLRGWSRIPGAEVVGIVSPDDAAASLAREYAVPDLRADLASALDELKPDAVDICTPPAVHGEQIALAAAAGAHVICQKPLAPGLGEAIAATRAARRAGVRLMVHENFRFRPWYRAAREVLAAGAIGEPIYFRSDCRIAGTLTSAAHPEIAWSLARQPYFATIEPFLLLESVIHQIDVASFFLGAPSSVYARARRVSPSVRGEDMVSLMMGFGQTTAVLERSYASRGHPPPPASESMLIEGTEGLIELDGTGGVTVTRDVPSGREQWSPQFDRTDAYANSFAATIAHFADGVLHDRPFETDAIKNLRILDVVFAAYRSIETGNAVSLPSTQLIDYLREEKPESI